MHQSTSHTTKGTKKRQVLHEITKPWGRGGRACFSNSFPLNSGASFSIYVLILQVRVNMKESEHNTTFKTPKLLTSKINPTIIL